jgi:hypothetical protein
MTVHSGRGAPLGRLHWVLRRYNGGWSSGGNRPSGAEVPSYQAYLVLAWLRKENMITQHGRQGYSLPSAVNLAASVKEQWERLPKW